MAERTPANRGAARRAQTRAALIRAARDLLGDGVFEQASIKAITDRADVGFGSFYNHFTSKPELGAAAMGAAFDDYEEWLDAVSPAHHDPVERLIVRIRCTGRLAAVRPDLHLLLSRNAGHREAGISGLAPQAVASAEEAIAVAPVDDVSAEVMLLSVCGAMAAVLRAGAQVTPAHQPRVADELATVVLTMLRLSDVPALRDLSMAPLSLAPPGIRRSP